MMKTALITGTNKTNGIGFACARSLLQKNFRLILVNRTDNPEAVSKLLKETNAPQDRIVASVSGVDLLNKESIAAATQKLLKVNSNNKENDLIDYAILNAGHAFTSDSTLSMFEQAKVTVPANFNGTVDMVEFLLPLMKPNSSFCVVSSQAGLLSRWKSPELVKKLTSDNSTIKEINEISQKFIELTKTGAHVTAGFPDSTYCVSKACLTAACRVLSKDPRLVSLKARINAICPGYCDSSMTNRNNDPELAKEIGRTSEEGSRIVTYLAREEEDRTGKFFYYDGKNYNSISPIDGKTLN